jgi:hypothetical protein
MTIDLEKLIEWLGVEGAIAGLDGSDLTTAELGELMPESKRSGHSKLKRRDLIKAMVEQKRLDLTKKPEELMAMDSHIEIPRIQRVFSMKARRGSTLSPISVVKISSAAMASSICTRSRRRTAGSMVVSQSCSGFISPRPL